MAKTTISDLKSLGFNREMFSAIAPDDVAFDALLTAVIAEHALQLSGRIGTTLYADTTSPNADYVKLAEKYLSAAELMQRRINITLGAVVSRGEDFSTEPERRQRKDYLDQAEIWIGKLAQGVTVDAPSEIGVRVITSTRFDQ